MASTRTWKSRLFGAAALGAVIGVSPLSAQAVASPPALAVVGGAWQYDLSGTGTSWFAGARIALPLTAALILEPGLTYARYTTQGGADVNYLIPEAQVQLELVRQTLRPFLGIGAGAAIGWAEGTSGTDLALTASAGVRADVSPQWGLLGELRVRAIDPWVGTVAEWTVGVSRRM